MRSLFETHNQIRIIENLKNSDQRCRLFNEISSITMSLKLKGKIHRSRHRVEQPERALTAPSHVADTNDARDTPEDDHRSHSQLRI